MKKPNPTVFWQTFLGFSALLSLPAFFETIQQVGLLEIDLWRSKWALLVVIFILNAVLGLWLAFSLRREWGKRLLSFLEFEGTSSAVVKSLGLLIFIAGIAFFWMVRYVIFGEYLPRFFPLLWTLWWASLLAGFGLRLLMGLSWAKSFAMPLLLQGVAFRVIGMLPLITDYPFSLGWSEASRYYYASLLFAPSIYGAKEPLSILHPTRYFLQSIPFLIPTLPLWAHRLWQVILWIGLTSMTAWALVRRLKLTSRWIAFLMSAWFFLYLLQGAVYYHLLVCVIIVLLGYSSEHHWRTLIAVLLSSFWAGMSRLNWFPVPAMLAIALYLMEVPVSTIRNLKRYLIWPAIWALLGVGAAIFSQAFYIRISGNSNLKAFGSSFTSDLLWYRLLPNPTYPMGVILGILFVSAPLLLVIYAALRGYARNWHVIRHLGLWAMLLVLFVGGLVVSTKIGGGGDLHNMDAYLAMLGLIAASLFSGRVAGEVNGKEPGSAPWPVVAMGILIPVGFALASLPFNLTYQYDHQQAAQELQTLDQAVTDASAHGEVLFIGERQLLTFKMIHSVPLVPEDEVVTLMEMAISHNSEYLNAFYNDLHHHRFAAIVARKQFLVIKENEAFAEENNAWTTLISPLLLCEYEPAVTLAGPNVQVYVPRAESQNCP
jgi:hypothetical protein